MPLSTPEKTVSGKPGIAGVPAGNARSAATITVKRRAATMSALAELNHAAMKPANAGPIARARLNATAPSATAECNSARGTRSLMSACCAGR